MKQSLYDKVTNKIIEQLEKGVVPWQRPWEGGSHLPFNYVTKRTYRGVNVWLLQCSSFSSNYWASYKQWASVGAQVKKGEKATEVVFFKFFEKDEKEGKVEKFPVLKSYWVFNFEQTEGLELPKKEPKGDKAAFTPIEECEAIVGAFPLGFPKPAHIGPTHVGHSRAYYNPKSDSIAMPCKSLFASEEGYYSVLFHESVHATGHESRLNRKTMTDSQYFGDKNYKEEELVAELGASYLCGFAGILNATIENSAAYLSNWCAALRKDSKLIFKSSSAAQKACDYLLNVKFENKEDTK